MKIHDKLICYFESCKSPVDKEGYLSKKGEIKTSYQKRWFMLKGNLLFYKDRPTDREPIGVIVLEGCTVQLCESEEKFAFSLVWSEPGLRTYKFSAEDQVGQESWIKALLSASHSYLALLVMDMEKKYRDALKAFPDKAHKTLPNTHFYLPQAEHSLAYLNPHSSTLSPYVGHAAEAGPRLNSGQLPPHPISWSPSALKKSSKLVKSKRSATVMPGSSAGPPTLDWPGFCLDRQENFSKLHEEYGKEIKALIAEWSRMQHDGEVVQENNLIDFG